MSEDCCERDYMKEQMEGNIKWLRKYKTIWQIPLLRPIGKGEANKGFGSFGCMAPVPLEPSSCLFCGKHEVVGYLVDIYGSCHGYCGDCAKIVSENNFGWANEPDARAFFICNSCSKYFEGYDKKDRVRTFNEFFEHKRKHIKEGLKKAEEKLKEIYPRSMGVETVYMMKVASVNFSRARPEEENIIRYCRTDTYCQEGWGMIREENE